MTSGLLVNPASGRSSGKGMALADELRRSSQVPVRVLNDFSQIESHLEDLAKAGVTELFLSGGDGTVQAVQTILAERSPFAALPRVGLLPHGTTNMTAATLGFRRRGAGELAAFLRHPVASEIVTCPTLRVANPRDGTVRHGMFLGTGAVTWAVTFCQEAVHKAGLKGEMASFATLAAVLGKALFGPRGASDKARIDQGHAMTVRNGGRIVAAGEKLMLLATTLDRLILRTTPFWGRREGPLRVTIFPHPVPSLVRWLLPMMYGGEGRAPPPGLVSFSGAGFDIATATAFVLDGEFFEPPVGEALRVELGPEFAYIRR